MRGSSKREPGGRETKSIGQRTLTVPIERIVPGGLGLGHAERKTVLAAFVAPGDVARIAVDRVRGNTVLGTLIEVIEPGAERIAPMCPHFGVCGGCDFQHLTYKAQLAAKQEIVKDCFRRIGGISLDQVEIVASPNAWGYRIRAEWAVDPVRPAMGYRKRSSQEILDIVTCPILDPELERARIQLHERVHAGEIAITGEIASATAGGVVGMAPRIDEESATMLWTTINDERYGFDASCFFQTNGSLLPGFVRYVIDEASQGGGKGVGHAVDLFAGVGLFTVPLARQFARVTGVESHARSASLAHENAKAAGLTNVSVSGLPVEHWLRRRGERGERPDVIVMDPPRVGLAPDVVEALIHVGAERLVYASCDPATLARDVKALTAGGYKLAKIRAFDMFPQTHHVEVVATCVRSRADEGSGGAREGL